MNSSNEALQQKLITLASPIEKRIGLSLLTLELCRNEATTDALHVCLMGGWVSACLYRRGLLSVFDECFSLVKGSEVDADNPKLVPMSRKIKDELVLAAVLIPFMETDLSAPFSHDMYCADASDKKGAICVSRVGARTTKVLWRTQKGKAAYTRMRGAGDAMQAYLDKDVDQTDGAGSALPQVSRPLAFRFDFLEIFAGAARITAEVERRGWVCGPPVDLSESPGYDLMNWQVMSWLSHLIVNKLIKGFAVEPPCATFSVMRRPPLRSKEVPFGFEVTDGATHTGNVLMHRGFQCMYLAAKHDVGGLYETPYTSKAKKLPSFSVVASMPEVSATRVDSCRFESPHLKSFLFLSCGIAPDAFDKQCQCSCNHVQVQGQYTKASATYTWPLASAIADSFHSFLMSDTGEDLQEVAGLENQLVNEVASGCEWKEFKTWNFKKVETHINIKELSSIYRLVLELARLKRPQRVVALTDSNVVRGALQKGRSGSGSLKRIGSVTVAVGIFLVSPYVPTRLNASDDLTRDREVRGVSSTLCVDDWTDEQLMALAEMRPLRKVFSKWVRLFLLLCGPIVMQWNDRSRYRSFRRDCGKSRPSHPTMQFDSSLGFPGEGPSFCFLWIFLFLLLPFLLWNFPVVWILVVICQGHSSPIFRVGFVVGFSCSGAMAMNPRTPGDFRRAEIRNALEPLPSGRPVTTTTNEMRKVLLRQFLEWIDGQGIDSDALFKESHRNLEDINLLLGAFGRKCYTAGKSLNVFSETINSVASWKPHLRRTLQDVAYSWAHREPPTHHAAMPAQVLLAMLSVCFIWGWTRVAGCISLAWGGLLRPGELFQAKRADLYLPSDGGRLDSYALLAIAEPKTRYTAARHQCAKVDAPDLVQVLELCFSQVLEFDKLWGNSPQSFRARFRQLLAALDLVQNMPHSYKQLELSSFRPGGATWLLQQCESGDVVMRRGRWSSYRMMSIYIQEINSMSFLMKLPKAKRDRVNFLASCFPEVLQRVQSLSLAGLPASTWYLTMPNLEKH